jgi:hypothetical protein
MLIKRLLVAVAMGLGCTPAAALAQTSPVRPGARVRATHTCGPLASATQRTDRLCTVTGSFVQIRADTLAVSTGDSTAHFALDSLVRFEVSYGQRTYRWIGAGAGLVSGVGLSYLVLHSGGSTSLCDRSANQDAMSARECLGVMALGGLAGAGLGALAGSLIRTERWVGLPIGYLRIGLAPGASPRVAVHFRVRGRGPRF